MVFLVAQTSDNDLFYFFILFIIYTRSKGFLTAYMTKQQNVNKQKIFEQQTDKKAYEKA